MGRMSDITGVVLAGGRSSRMGRDKALLELNGVPFIQVVAETLRAVFDQVVISANQEDAYRFLNLPIISDIYRDCGPMAGIHSALTHATTERIYILSCDLPLITPDIVRSLLRHSSEADVAVASDGINMQPLCGVYRRRCLTLMEDRLRRGKFSVQKFITDVGGVGIPIPPAVSGNAGRVLSSINTIEEYADLIQPIPPSPAG